MNGTAAMVATSTDRGQTWSNIVDVGAVYGLKNIAFPAAVAGDPGRAAVAFYCTVTATGDSNADNFTGVWHLYVAHTFDGGAHWTTSDVTPKLPMQGMGLLRGGDGPMDRNLLDFFDITIDRDGRVQVGYVDAADVFIARQQTLTSHPKSKQLYPPARGRFDSSNFMPTFSIRYFAGSKTVSVR